jgi:multidrug efflux pump subunit AcrA (membrane-fusion protein)
MVKKMLENNRKIRNKRRNIAIGIIIPIAVIIALLAYFINGLGNTPEVTAIDISNGDIASKMYVKAQISPGSTTEYNIKQKQRVLKVNVKVGDIVKTGDVLLTLDILELQEQYNNAKAARKSLEASKAAQDASNKAIAAQKQKDQKDFELQINRMSGSITRIVSNLTLLATTQSTTINIPAELSEIISSQLSGLNPDPVILQQQIQELIDTVTQGVNVADNPEYAKIIENINKDTAILGTSLPTVLKGIGGTLTSGLATGLTSGLTLSSDLTSQLGSLGLNTGDSLANAKELEKSTKEALDQAVTSLVATGPGIVAEINTKTGSYIGTSTSQSTSSLDSLLSGALGESLSGLTGSSGSASSQTSPIVIYDNTAPKAIFKVSQFDSEKLKPGLSVEYTHNNKKYTGEIIYKSKFVEDAKFNSPSSNSLLEQAGIVGVTGSDPQLTIEMSVNGSNLTDLVLGFLIDAEIKTASANNVIVLPAQAMRRELNEYYVFLVDKDNKLVRKPFTPGIQSDMYVEVLSGLNAGDKVVLNPTNEMSNGLKVKLKGDN